MARVTKRPDERRAELVAAARRLFEEKGFAATTVGDIVKSVGVAQGTFYWYFTSKDEILVSVAQQIAEQACSAVEAAADQEGLSALEKFSLINDPIPKSLREDAGFVERIHAMGGRSFHEQLNREIIRRLAPIMTKIIKQGVDEGIFKTDHPVEDATFILSAALDPHNLYEEGMSYDQIRIALIDFILKGLGSTPPSQKKPTARNASARRTRKKPTEDGPKQ